MCKLTKEIFYNIFDNILQKSSKIFVCILLRKKFQKIWKYLSSACDGHLGTEGGFWQWINLSTSANSPERKSFGHSCCLKLSIILSFQFILLPPANILSSQIWSFQARLVYQMRDWLQKRQNMYMSAEHRSYFQLLKSICWVTLQCYNFQPWLLWHDMGQNGPETFYLKFQLFQG